MNLCWKVYLDKKNKHYSFAIAKNINSNKYLLVNLTSFKTEGQFNFYNGCKFNKSEMYKILTPHIYNLRGRNYSFIFFNKDSSITEKDLLDRIKGEKQANFPEEFKHRVKTDVKSRLRGDLKREFGDCL